MIASLVVAAAANEVIGRDGDLPWYLPADLRRFRAITTGHVVVMGRRTHESILARLGHPLTGRTSVVITSAALGTCGSGVVQADSVERGLAAAADLASGSGGDEFFVIGGASVYAQALAHIDRILLTRVHAEVPGDTRMPEGWLDGFALTGQERQAADGESPACSFLEYRRVGR